MNKIHLLTKLFVSILLLQVLSCSSKNNTERSGDYSNEIKRILTFDERKLDSLDSDRQIVNLIVEAKKYEDRREYAHSALLYQKALQYDSTSSLLFMLGNSLFEAGMYNDAKNAYKASLLIDIDNTKSLSKLINIYIIENDFRSAEVLIGKLLENADDKESMLTVAELYSKTDSRKAIEIYEELHKKYPDQTITLKLLNLYSSENEQKKYYSLLFDYVENNPESSIKYIDDLLMYYIENDNISKFNELLDIADKDVSQNGLNKLFSVVSAKFVDVNANFPDKFKFALLERIDSRFILQADINYNAGIIAYKLSKNEAGDNYFQRALKAAEELDVTLPFYIGYFYFDNNEYKKSVNVLSDYVHIKQQGVWELDYYLAHSYLAMDQKDSAVKYLKTAMMRDSTKFFIYTDIGLVYDGMGKSDSAIYYYDMALSLNPDDNTTLNNYAYTLAQAEQDLDKALEMINKVIAQDSLRPTFLDTYAWVKYKMGDYESAKEYLIKANENSEENAEILYHLAEVYKKLGILDKAKDFADKAFAIEPDNKDIKKLIQELRTP